MRMNFLQKILISWGIFWGVLGIGLYFLGLLNLFYPSIVITYGVICFLVLLFFLHRQNFFLEIKPFFSRVFKSIKKDWIIGLILVGFFVFAVFNFLIDLAPEVGFDALWYHLTLPKIYLETHNVSYIPGGLLYYSVMPRLAEMIYGFTLACDPSGLLAKIIHYSFGLFWAGGIYVFSRLFLSKRAALLAVLACYGTYITTWLSQTAYIDLIIAFYAVLSLWGIFQYLQSQKPLFLYLSAIFMGLVLAGKLYGLFLFASLILVLAIQKKWLALIRFSLISLVIVLPFYLQAYFSTGNPFYPVFSIQDSALAMYTGGYNNLKDWYLQSWWKNLLGLFFQVAVYRFTPFFALIFLFFFGKNWRKAVLPLLLFLAFFILWSLNPVQESRYFIVIVPVIGLIAGYTFENIDEKFFKVMAILLLLSGLVYNFSFGFIKFSETLEMVTGKNRRENYLKARLEPPRNFYDFSGNFTHEVGEKKALTVNVHNLFYLGFDFTDLSFIEKDLSVVSASDLANNLKKRGINYVLIGEYSLEKWFNLPKEEIDKSFTIVFRENNFTLYKVNEQK